MNQTEHFNARIKNIIDHKALLDAEYLKEIDPKKYRQNIFRMLKLSKITDKINKDGILDDLLTEMNQEVAGQAQNPLDQSKFDISNKQRAKQNQLSLNLIQSNNSNNQPLIKPSSILQDSVKIPAKQNLLNLQDPLASNPLIKLRLQPRMNYMPLNNQDHQLMPLNAVKIAQQPTIQLNQGPIQIMLDQNQNISKQLNIQQKLLQPLPPKQSNFGQYSIIQAQLPANNQQLPQQFPKDETNKPSFSAIVQNMQAVSQNPSQQSIQSKPIQPLAFPLTQQINQQPKKSQSNYSRQGPEQSLTFSQAHNLVQQKPNLNKSIANNLYNSSFFSNSKSWNETSIKLPSIKEIQDLEASHNQSSMKTHSKQTENSQIDSTPKQIQQSLHEQKPIQILNQSLVAGQNQFGLSNLVQHQNNFQVTIPAQNQYSMPQFNHKKLSFGIQEILPLNQNIGTTSVLSQSIQSQYISDSRSNRFQGNDVQPQAQLVKNIKNKALNQMVIKQHSLNDHIPKSKSGNLQSQLSAKKLHKYEQMSLNLPMFSNQISKPGQNPRLDTQSMQVMPKQVTQSHEKQIESKKLQFMHSIFDATKTQNYLSQLNESMANSKHKLSNNASHGSESHWNGNVNQLSRIGTRGAQSLTNQKSQFQRSHLASLQNKNSVKIQAPANTDSQESIIQEQVNAINKQIQDALNYSENSSVNQIQAQVQQAQVQQAQQIFGRRRSISCHNLLNPQQVAHLHALNENQKAIGQNQPLKLNIVDPSLIRIHNELKLSDQMNGSQKDKSNFLEESLKCGSNASFYYPASRQSSPKNEKSKVVQNFIQDQFQNTQPTQQKLSDFQHQIFEKIGRNFNLKELTSQFGQSHSQIEYPGGDSNMSVIKSNIDMLVNNEKKQTEPIQRESLSSSTKPEGLRQIEKIQMSINETQKEHNSKLAKLEQTFQRIEHCLANTSLGIQQGSHQIQQIIAKLKDEFVQIDKKNDQVHKYIDSSSMGENQGPQLPKMLDVKKIIEQQQLSNSKISSSFNKQKLDDFQDKIDKKMLITRKYPQFEVSNNMLSYQKSNSQQQFVQGRAIKPKKGCVPSKFAQNQNESMHDCNSSSSGSFKEPLINHQLAIASKNQEIQSPQFQRNENSKNSLTIKDLIQAQIQNIDSQNKAMKRQTDKSADSNRLYNNESLKDHIAATRLNLGDSNSVSRSLSSSSGTELDLKILQNQNKYEDDELERDSGQSVSSMSIDNVPQSTIPKLSGLNIRRLKKDESNSIQMHINSKIFKSQDVALDSQKRSSGQTLNKSYNKIYLDSIDKGSQSIKHDQIMSEKSHNSKMLHQIPQSMPINGGKPQMMAQGFKNNMQN